MTDPKIRYDIEAATKGEAGVEELAQAVRRLGENLEGDLKVQANETADALEKLGAKKDAVVAFQQLTNEAGSLSIELAEADAKVKQLAGDLPAAAAAVQRLSIAQGEAHAKLDAATADLKEQRAALTTLKTEYTGAARNTDEYKESQAVLSQRIKDLRAEINLKKAALKASEADTNAAVAAEKKLSTEYTAAGNAAVKASDAVRSNTGALVAAKSSLDGFGVSTSNLAQSERMLEAAIAQVRERVVGLAPAFAQAAAASNTATQHQVADQRSLAQSYQGIQSQLQSIQTIASIAVGGSFLTGLIKSAAETADEFKNLRARMQLVVGEGPAFETVFKDIADLALATHSPLAETGTLFSKLAKAGTDAGLSAAAASEQSLALTRTINQSIQLSGASADASSAAITQLIQGLQSGVLRGDEFNSVMEQAPRLAQALAQGLGRTTGELRGMAEQGALTAATVIKALTSQSDVVEREFAKLPMTVGRSLQDLSTQWTLYVGAADNGMASSANLAKIISGLASNLDTLVSVLYAAGKAWAAIKIAGLAADVYRFATATATATAATAANTTALVGNTAAQVGNAAAARASATSASAQAAAVVANTQRITAAGSVLGRFSVLLGPVGIGLAALSPEIISLGQALGEGIAKWQGYGKAIEAAEAQARMQEAGARENAKEQRLLALALEEARNAQFQLTKEGVAAVASFDDLRKKGESAADALEKIGKGFDLSTVPGIKNAGSVLDKLLAEAKITAEQFQAAFATALKGEDLLLFETRARAAFSGAKREAELLAQTLDSTAREAIRRTGLDFDLISGGMSKATRSALNDTDAILTSFARLKTEGVDVGTALGASLKKALDTAENQKSLDAVIKQIESLRGKLGSTVTDGLLDLAKKKADELAASLAAATPGIQSVAEAMKNLGVTSDKALKDTADSAKKNYDFLTASGQASARELTAAFMKYAEEAIAANKGVANDSLKIEAAIRGVTIATDEQGKSTVKAYADSKAAVLEYGAAVADMGTLAREAAGRALDEIERQLKANEALLALKQKIAKVDSSGFEADAKGQRVVAGSDLMSLTGIAAFLKNAGVQDEDKARAIAREFADANGNVQYMGNKGQAKYGGETISVALLRAAERVTFGLNGGSASTPGGTSTTTIPQSAETRTINLQLQVNGTNYGTVETNAAGAAAVQAVLAQLTAAKAAST